MSNMQMFWTIFIIAVAVQTTRWLPFLFFKDSDRLPDAITYLGKVIPAAMMGMLVVYCYKDYDFASISSALPAVIAGLGCACIHLWKRNTILSIAVGTALYMILLRLF